MRLYISKLTAAADGIFMAERNGAPVVLLRRDDWFRVEEDAEAMDAAIGDGWEEVVMLYPSEVAR